MSTDANPVIGLTAEQLQQILAAVKSDDAQRDARLGEIMAQARQPKPENEHLPPAQDPNNKPDLKCRMFDCGFPIGKDVYSAEAITLLNQIAPGEYRIKKGDNSMTVVTVDGDRDAGGALTQMRISREAKGDKKHNWPPFVDVLKQIVAQQAT